MTDPRTRIIEAAARCYAQLGSRGATTRRIAEAAGVNEITLFRHFGSKEALLDLVLKEWAAIEEPPSLPEVPADPVAELTAWVAHQHDQLSQWRTFIRRSLGEVAEHPDASKATCESSTYSSAHLNAYVRRLQAGGFLYADRPQRDADMHHACVMLTSAVFTDAVWRDLMPPMFPGSPAEAVGAYVRLFGQAIGLREEFLSHAVSESTPAPVALAS